MYAAIKMILKPYESKLRIEREHLLRLMPSRIDCLVIKKDGNTQIDMDVFRFFRKHNVIEFKGYDDKLNIDVLWQSIAFAAQYKANEKKLNAIWMDEITMSSGIWN